MFRKALNTIQKCIKEIVYSQVMTYSKGVSLYAEGGVQAWYFFQFRFLPNSSFFL